MTETNETPPGPEGQSELDPAAVPDNEPAPGVTPQEPVEAKEKKRRDPVKWTTFVVLMISLTLLVVHLIADRFTPHTSQARIQARVVPVAPQVSGVVTSVEVGENQFVDSDQVLLNIDPTNYELALQVAEADLQAAKQGVGAAEANILAAEAGVEAARSGVNLAEIEATRLTRIREADPGAISDRRVVMAQTSLEASQASLDSALANLERARQDLGRTGAKNASILKARAALDQARVNMERTVVRSPGIGLVTGVKIDRGNFAAAGAPLMTFVGVHNLWVQADFTENNIGHIEPGDSVQIIFDVYPGRIFSGTIRSVGYGVSVDSTPLGSLPTIENDRSWLRDAQRFPVVIDFESPESAGVLIKIGSQASVIVYTGVHPIMNTLGRLRMRLESLLTYFY